MITKPLARLGLIAAVILSGPVSATAAAPPKPAKTIIGLPLKLIIPSGQRLCTAKTASGLGTMMLRPGGPARPQAGDAVKVNYIGYFASSGEVFDQGTAAAFPVGGVIKGFGEGLQLMGKGAVQRLCIPAALGYGTKETGPIPPNSDLVFQVEMLDFGAGVAAQ